MITPEQIPIAIFYVILFGGIMGIIFTIGALFEKFPPINKFINDIVDKFEE